MSNTFDADRWFEDEAPEFDDLDVIWHKGAVIDACYQLIELISDEGGFGLVWKAKESVSGDSHETGRVVAIKVFITKRDMDSWIAEFTSFASMSSRNGIVDLYRAGRDASGRPFIVTQYINGQTLHEKISHGLSIKDSRRYLRQLASALVQLHKPIPDDKTGSKSIVHCDLKPSNIMVCAENDEVVILDLGTARVISGNNSSTPSIGSTELYKVPETTIDPSVPPTQQQDIFQFGLIGFEMLTGKKYWECDQTSRGKELTNIGSFRHPVLRSTRSIIQKSLEWEPNKRFMSAKKVRNAFKRFRVLTSLLTPSTISEAKNYRAMGILVIITYLIFIPYLYISIIDKSSEVKRLTSEIRLLEKEVMLTFDPMTFTHDNLLNNPDIEVEIWHNSYRLFVHSKDDVKKIHTIPVNKALKKIKLQNPDYLKVTLTVEGTEVEQLTIPYNDLIRRPKRVSLKYEDYELRLLIKQID